MAQQARRSKRQIVIIALLAVVAFILVMLSANLAMHTSFFIGVASSQVNSGANGIGGVGSAVTGKIQSINTNSQDVLTVIVAPDGNVSKNS